MRTKFIDLIKGASVIAVILLHSFSKEVLLSFGALFHIWHAVPLFLISSGYTSSFFYEKFNSNRYFKYYFIRFKKLAIPSFSVILIQLLLVFVFGNSKVDLQYIQNFIISGGSGPGSYFIYIAIQNIIFMPIIFFAIKKLRYYGLAIFFLVAFFFDLIAIVYSIPQSFYRISGLRYLFFLALGSMLFLHPSFIKTKASVLFLLLSFVYLCYFGFNSCNLNPVLPFWLTHTTLSSFYSLFLFLLIGRLSTDLFMSRILIFLGERSLFIFLTQMVYFWAFENVEKNYSYEFYSHFIDILVCCSAGSLFSFFYSSLMTPKQQ